MTERPRPPTRRLLWWGLQAAILLVVAAGVWHTIQSARTDIAATQAELEARITEARAERDAAAVGSPLRASLDGRLARLERSRLSWTNLRPGYLVGCGAFYFLAMLPPWLFYHFVVRRMDQRPTPWETFRAFVVSQMGKYVPGKAVVVVLRAALVRSERCHALPATMAVFAETLLGMAVGATMGSLVLVWKARETPWLIPVAIGMAVLCVVPTLPPLFRRVTTLLLAKKFGADLPRYLRGTTWSFFGVGWLILPWGWVFNGVSLWCALQAFPGVEGLDLPTVFPLVVGVAALSVVAGFITLLPGGLVIRELIITTLLGPVVGPPIALAAAVGQRLVWLAVELSVSGLALAIHPLVRARWPRVVPSELGDMPAELGDLGDTRPDGPPPSGHTTVADRPAAAATAHPASP